MKIFVEHIPTRDRCDQLGRWTDDKNRWHDCKAFLPALQLCAQRNLADARILVVLDDGPEVRLDIPDDTEFAFSFFNSSAPTALLSLIQR